MPRTRYSLFISSGGVMNGLMDGNYSNHDGQPHDDEAHVGKSGLSIAMTAFILSLMLNHDRYEYAH